MPGTVAHDPPGRVDDIHLLVSVDSQTRARDCKLEDEDQAKDDHVKEEQHLVVVNSPHEPSHCNEEKEDSHSNDSSNDVNTGHQTQALAPGSHANEQ